MPPCDRLLQAVTMPAAIGTKSFLLIGVASLLHAKATEPPPVLVSRMFRVRESLRSQERAALLSAWATLDTRMCKATLPRRVPPACLRRQVAK